MRRADLPLKFTEGFSPHPKLSIKRALKLGVESESEEASILLKEDISPEYFINKLQKELPEGIKLKDAKRDIN
jgi:radical SAM-linked protein